MDNPQIIEYSPLILLEEIDDGFLLDMIKTGDIHNFCFSLTLDLNLRDSKPDC